MIQDYNKNTEENRKEGSKGLGEKPKSTYYFDGWQGRIGLGDDVNMMNVGCKEHALRLVLSATVHAGVSDSEAAALTEVVKDSALPEIGEASDQMLWAVEVANRQEITPLPEDACLILQSVAPEEVPSDFRETMERHLRDGTHA
jgi:hypothetical protein